MNKLCSTLFFGLLTLSIVSCYVPILSIATTRLPPITNVGIPAGAHLGSAVEFLGLFTVVANFTDRNEIYAFGASGSNNNAGAIYLFNANYLASPSYAIDVNYLSDPSIGVTLRSGDMFGASLSVLADLDGNGFPELAVGAPGDNSNTGAVYIIYLGAPPTSRAANANLVPSILRVVKVISAVPTAGERFGASLASNFSGNGTDLIVGAPGALGGFGRYYLLSNLVTPTVATQSTLEQTTVTGRAAVANSGFGTAVASIGDVNGDRQNDLVFGFSALNQVVVNIKTTVFSSAPTTVTVITPSTFTNDTTGLFGYAVNRAGDFNADGVPDFIVGAPSGNGGAFIVMLNRTGRYADFTALTPVLLGDNSGSQLGTSVFYRINTGFANFVNGAVIGAANKSGGALVNQGGVYLGSLRLTAPSPTATVSLSTSVSPSLSPSISVTSSASSSTSSTPSSSSTPSASMTPSTTPSASMTPSTTPSASGTSTPSASGTSAASASATSVASASATSAATASATSAASVSPSPSASVAAGFLSFLWSDKCFSAGDAVNCGTA